jgi:hypothetical protein
MRSCERANETSARGGALCGDVVGGSRLPGSCHRRRLRAVAVPVGLSRCRMCTQSPACFSPPFMETASGGTVRWPVRDAGRALASFSPRSPAKRAFAAARPWRDARLHAASPALWPCRSRDHGSVPLPKCKATYVAGKQQLIFYLRDPNKLDYYYPNLCSHNHYSRFS